MDRSKIIAVITGAIAIAISIAYLLIVQILDFRTEMVPAPMGIITLFKGFHAIALSLAELSRSISSDFS